MPAIIVDLNISDKEILRYYQGTANMVVTRAIDGKTVRFPARILRQFVSHGGVYGRYKITYSENGHYESMVKL